MRRRQLAAWLGALALAGVLAGPAAATICAVPKKPVGAGSQVTVDLSGGAPVITPTNPGGQVHAGFATLIGLGPEPVDVFILPVTPSHPDPEGIGFGELPEPAHEAGGCDGKGVDDLEACGP